MIVIEEHAAGNGPPRCRRARASEARQPRGEAFHMRSCGIGVRDQTGAHLKVKGSWYSTEARRGNLRFSEDDQAVKCVARTARTLPRKLLRAAPVVTTAVAHGGHQSFARHADAARADI